MQQRFGRHEWLWLIGSVVVAGMLVALIPYYGLVGGHTEHAAMPEVLGSSHQVIVTPAGVDMIMTATNPDDESVIAAIRMHMADEAARFQAGDYMDAMGMVTSATAAALAAHAVDIRVTQRDDAAASTIHLSSPLPTVHLVLVQWAHEMNAMHHDTSTTP